MSDTPEEEPPILDPGKVLDFWNSRARKMASGDKVNLSNLEPDVELARRKQAEERQVLDQYIRPAASDRVLDLGAGHCAWAAYLSGRVAHVDCVEFSREMAAIGQQYLAENKVGNVTVHCMPAQEYQARDPYDIILISGLLIYLNPADFKRLLANLDSLLARGGRIILRDGTAREETYTIRGRYSEGLQADYSAHYRTARQYIDSFARAGFEIVRHQNMYADGSVFNKWKETILRVYEFRRAGDSR